MKKIIPIFVPHQGCPHDCIFCNQKKITGISTDMTGEIAKEIIENALLTIPKEADIEIAFFGGSFTAIEKEKQEELLSVAYFYKKKGIVNDIRLSTRPDCIDKNILSLLEKYGVSVIELGVQSMDKNVLIDSIRGHNDLVVFESAKLIKDSGITLGLQMMLGLPSDTEEKCLYTAKKFIEIGPEFVRIYPTLVVSETGLEDLYMKNMYSPFTLEESVEITKKLLVMFYMSEINVIRVGLQATEEIKEGVDVVAGPYHPAFREIVLSRIYRDFIDEYCEGKINNIVVKCSNRKVSPIVGNKKSNKIYFKEKFGANFKIIAQNNLNENIIVEIDDSIMIETNEKNIYEKLNHKYFN